MAQAYVIAFQKGEERGLNYFFNLHFSALCYFAFSLLKDQPAAEEITDDAFVKLWHRHADFSTPATIKAFLYVTVRNACIDRLRRHKRELAAHKEVAYLSELSEPSIQQQVIRAETLRQVYAALQQLSPQCRQVFQLFYFEDKSYTEIAEAMGLSVSTVRNHKARALALLRQELKGSLPVLILCLLMYAITR